MYHKKLILEDSHQMENKMKNYNSEKPGNKKHSKRKPRTYASQQANAFTRGKPSRNRNQDRHKPRQEASQGIKTVRLNKFIAQCGVCARREADKLIEAGKIKVNGKVVTAMGTQIDPRKDVVMYLGKALVPQNHVYILYNKPKNVITTAKDPQGRKTVIDMLQNAANERIFPVGRLDRNTTGLLLLTNDGDFAKKLTHPKYRVRKVYKVKLDRPVLGEDMEKLLRGIELEDGYAKVDKIDYVANGETNEVGVEIHIGKNRIVRRLFEALGYKVITLDRTAIAHLTKKKLTRGKWRFLSGKEIAFLKMI